MGTAATDIHTEIETQYTTTHTLSFLETWGRGDSTQGYTYGDRDTIYHPYTLSFLETWGRGDSTQGYTYGDRDTIYHPYKLSCWRLGDVGTVPKDIHTEIGAQYTTPINSHFEDLGTWGQYPRIYIRR